MALYPMGFDPYQVLGVAKEAAAEDIRKAYRSLARRLHPDLNKDEDAEQRFKELSLAYAILVDPAKRALFNTYGERSLSAQFSADLRRAGSPRPPASRRRPADITARLEIDAALARTGGQIQIQCPVGGGPLRVTIPAGAEEGMRLRLPGRGMAATAGERPGDLYLELAIRGCDPSAPRSAAVRPDPIRR